MFVMAIPNFFMSCMYLKDSRVKVLVTASASSVGPANWRGPGFSYLSATCDNKL